MGMINVEPRRIVAGVGMLGSLLFVAYGATTMWSSRAPRASLPMPPVIAAVEPAGAWAAARLIPRGQRIAAADLVLLPLHENLPANAVTRLDAAVGKIAIVDVQPYALILADRISSDPGRAGLALTIPAGYRAVALRTNDEVATSNFIRPGDHVDVQIVMRENVLPKQDETQEHEAGNPSEALTLLQDVMVLSVGETLSDEPTATAAQNAARRADPPHAVSLALTPEQVSQFVLGRALGILYLALRNPSDLQSVRTTVAHLPDLRGPAAPVEAGKRPIELITGSKSQTIYSAEPSRPR